MYNILYMAKKCKIETSKGYVKIGFLRKRCFEHHCKTHDKIWYNNKEKETNCNKIKKI
jgi:hypothetical protein